MISRSDLSVLSIAEPDASSGLREFLSYAREP
jgi:hypothetical protein